MVMYRGLADDLALMDWLQKYIFPAEAKTVSPEFVRVGTRLAAARDDRVGHDRPTPTCITSRRRSRRRPSRPGCAACSGETIIQFPVADAKTPAEALARAERFIKEFKDDGLIVPAVAPHALYTHRQGDAASRRRRWRASTACRS